MQEEYKAKTTWKGREREEGKETGTNNEKQVGKIEVIIYPEISDLKFNEAATIVRWNICSFFWLGIPIVLVMKKTHSKLPNSMAKKLAYFKFRSYTEWLSSSLSVPNPKKAASHLVLKCTTYLYV